MVHGAGGGHLAELRLPCPHYGCLRKSVLLLFLFFFLIFSRIAPLPWPCKHVPAAPRAVMLLSADYYLLPTGTGRPYRARACSHSRGREQDVLYHLV